MRLHHNSCLWHDTWACPSPQLLPQKVRFPPRLHSWVLSIELLCFVCIPAQIFADRHAFLPSLSSHATLCPDTTLSSNQIVKHFFSLFLFFLSLFSMLSRTVHTYTVATKSCLCSGLVFCFSDSVCSLIFDALSNIIQTTVVGTSYCSAWAKTPHHTALTSPSYGCREKIVFLLILPGEIRVRRVCKRLSVFPRILYGVFLCNMAIFL